ncbi:MAG: type II toxin-antitoxin system VapC family toxin [Bryobacteraceae bacterium]
MDAFVIDVSACMPWCCEDEATPASEQLLQLASQSHTLYVPSVWPWEMMNAVAVAVRRQRIKPEHAVSFLGLLSSFDFRIEESPKVADLPTLHALALRHQLTAYDTAYLDLAKRLDLPLATLDDALKRAASAEGVQLL